jgi:hypothetical protein
MSEWPMVKLGEYCDVIMGQAPKGIDVNEDLMGLPLIAGAGDFSSTGVEVSKWTEKPTKICIINDIILSVRATVGTYRFADRDYCLGRGVAALRAKDNLDQKYLSFVIDFYRTKLLSAARGATFLQISKADIETLMIPLPPLGEQKRIAEILGGASKAINAIRTEIKRVESLCGAVVSPYAEDQSTKKLEDLATLSGGLSLGSHRKNKPHSVGYLRVANVFWGKILYDEIKELNCTDQEFERTLLQDGDVLITEAHANRFQVGRSAVFRGEEQALVFQNHLFRARPNKNIDSDVLAAMLSSVAVRRQLYQMAKTTSGLNTISISQVRSLRVPVLDTTKQAELLSFLQESNKLNHLLHRKLSLLQELQKSLATRAFAGLL